MKDSLGLYLNHIGQFELLTAARERELATRVQAARREANRPDGDPVTVARGDRARTELVLANLRLVVSIARRYPTFPGADLGDLIQAGNIALAHAVDLFDPARGFRFSTYATNWIRQGISRFLDKHCSSVSIPIEQAQRARSALRDAEGSEKDLPPGMRAVAAALHPAALDSEVAEGLLLVDVVAAMDVPSPEEEAIASDQARWARSLLRSLPDPHRTAVVLRFGLDSGGPR